MSCQLVPGGPVSIFPLMDEQIARLRELANVFASNNMPPGPRLVPRFGAAMKPDGAPFYLVTYSPSAPARADWRGLFFMDQGPYQITGIVRAAPNTGIVSVEASVLAGPAGSIVSVRWVVTGPAVGTTPTNIAGMLTELEITNPGPHARECLQNCLALHAPQCVPLREGNEPELVATLAAVAASCLINCRC